MPHSHLIRTLVSTAVLVSLALPCLAGDFAIYKYKVGDRIDVDRNMSPPGSPGVIWKPGTIRKISDGGYWVELDENPGGPDSWALIPARDNKWTRPAQSTPASADGGTAAAGAASGASFTMQQQPAPQPHYQPTPGQPKTLPGQMKFVPTHKGPHVPTVEHIRSMIYDRQMESYLKQFKLVKIDFEDVQVLGRVRRPELDAGNALKYYGLPGIEIPAYRATAKYKVFYESGSVKHLDEFQSAYYWYLDEFGNCTLNSVKGTIPKQIY